MRGLPFTPPSITWYERSDALLVIWLSRRVEGRGRGESVIINCPRVKVCSWQYCNLTNNIELLYEAFRDALAGL